VNQTASAVSPPPSTAEPTRSEPPQSSAPPQRPAETPADAGESFWSKVKRGLTGGA
jgi:hypothetical protein